MIDKYLKEIILSKIKKNIVFSDEIKAKKIIKSMRNSRKKKINLIQIRFSKHFLSQEKIQ